MKTATQFLMAFIAIATFTFAGCKKDKDKEEDKKASVVGKWQFVKVEVKQTYQGKTTNETEEAPAGSFVDFKADGSFSGKTTIDFTGTWKLTNNRVFFDGAGAYNLGADPDGHEIKKISASELVLFSDDKDGDFSSETTMYLKK